MDKDYSLMAMIAAFLGVCLLTGMLVALGLIELLEVL